ncbi:hypothetical protein RSSM_00123 [Rhodopirellula sallentina SM41]|uniref:Uncharacterized protein n=1 Tax=Rhodopirellula sallentina SM41 TaxID=1263870 RepID=M5UR29_9BACT|nr:hypothetical protein RSSM_00123 [Rhodopirellula sallentina SM41]
MEGADNGQVEILVDRFRKIGRIVGCLTQESSGRGDSFQKKRILFDRLGIFDGLARKVSLRRFCIGPIPWSRQFCPFGWMARMAGSVRPRELKR